MKELAKTLGRQFTGNCESRAAGMVINTMGWIEGVGYEVCITFLDLCPLMLVAYPLLIFEL